MLLIGTVTEFLEEKEILGGFVVGLGAVRNPTLGVYDIEKQEYLKRTFEENMELGGLTGSIGSVDGKPVLHAHATVSGPELIAFSGHLFEAEVAATAELMVWGLGVELLREKDEDVGLKLFRFEPRPEPAEEQGEEEAGEGR